MEPLWIFDIYIYIYIVCVGVCVCMLANLRTGKYDRIMRWWGSKPRSGIATVLDSPTYCYIIIPRPTCYSSPQQRYHTSSFAHPGINHIRPRISSYCTRSFYHPGASYLRTRILTPLSAPPPPSGSYRMNISPFAKIRYF